jgi:hypothetical protein
MITKFKNSWQLFKVSLTVTLRYRKLLWFPILTTLLTACIALFFISAMAIPVAMHHTGYPLNQRQHWVALADYYLPAPASQPQSQNLAAGAAEPQDISPADHSTVAAHSGHLLARRDFRRGSLCLLVLYFVSMFAATFCNVAFYHEIIAALSGQGVSFRRGFGVARSRWLSILAWSLLAGLVGWLIRAIEERLPLAKRIVAGLIGLAWSVAAVFAIPVIIGEEPTWNPLKILKKSALTLKQTWGEELMGNIGFSAGNFVFFLGWLLSLFLVGAIALHIHNIGLMITAAAIWVLALISMSYLSSVARHVYRCVLYLYAAEGVVIEPYTQDMLNSGWKVKKS